MVKWYLKSGLKETLFADIFKRVNCNLHGVNLNLIQIAGT